MNWDNIIAAAMLAGFVGCWYFWLQRQRQSPASTTLRPIAAYDALPDLCATTLESGQGIQLNWGNATLGSAQTPDALATMQVLRAVANTATLSAKGVKAVSADPTALLLAQDILIQAYHNNPNSFAPYQAENVHWQGDSGVSAVAGMHATALADRPAMQISFGAFGAEAAILHAAPQHAPTILASSHPSAQQLSAVLTPERTLLGEDIYAAGAYLSREPHHLASLNAQDTARVLMIAAIIIGSIILTVKDLLR